MKGLLMILCLVYVSCAVVLPGPSWKVPFEYPGDENRHGDYMGSKDFDPIRLNYPATTFSSHNFGHEYRPQNHNFDRPHPNKNERVPMMVGPSVYINKPDSSKHKENHDAFQQYNYNYHTPQPNQLQFHDKKPVISESSDFNVPFNFGSDLNGRPRSVQYEFENNADLRGHHNNHHYKPLHQNGHNDFPPFPHKQDAYKYPAISENSNFQFHNFHEDQIPHSHFLYPTPAINTHNKPKDEMKQEIMPSEEKFESGFHFQYPTFGRSMVFEDEAVPDNKVVNDREHFEYNNVYQSLYKISNENDENRHMIPANNDFGHPNYNFGSGPHGNKIVQNHDHTYHNNFKPEFYGVPEFGFTLSPHNLYHNSPGTADLNSFYFYHNHPFMNVFSHNPNFNRHENALKPAPVKGENKQEGSSLEKIDDDVELDRGLHHGYHHSSHIYYKPVITEEGDIKFVPVYFHPQVGYYPPFEYFFGLKPDDKEEDSVKANEEKDITEDNNDKQEQDSTLNI